MVTYMCVKPAGGRGHLTNRSTPGPWRDFEQPTGRKGSFMKRMYAKQRRPKIKPCCKTLLLCRLSSLRDYFRCFELEMVSVCRVDLLLAQTWKQRVQEPLREAGFWIVDNESLGPGSSDAESIGNKAAGAAARVHAPAMLHC